MPQRMIIARLPRVLIADDDPLARLMVVQRLRGIAEFSEAGDGEAATAALDSHPTDLIVLDLDMPLIDGVRLIEHVRSRADLRHIPIIVLTASEGCDSESRSYLAGATSVLYKPLNWKVFGAHVRHLLEIAFRSSYLASHDQLTGLANRLMLDASIKHLLENGLTSDAALLALDLDGFKAVNDTLGHAGGDALLVEIAGRIRECIPGGAIAARLGGDEFAILCKTSRTDALGLATTIGTALTGHYSLPQGRAFVGVSIGIALFGPETRSPDHVIREADLALYAAKRHEKGSMVIFSAELDRQFYGALQELTMGQARTLQQPTMI